jgi:hypothetical protein
MRSPIEIRLLAEPTRLHLADRERFRIGLVATNTSQEAIDPQLYAARLLVDGEPSAAFDLALGNGVMPAGWDVLPPGGTTPVVEWRLGDALFPEPGEYHLVLRLEVRGWEPVEASQAVVVTP